MWSIIIQELPIIMETLILLPKPSLYIFLMSFSPSPKEKQSAAYSIASLKRWGLGQEATKIGRGVPSLKLAFISSWI